MQHTITLQPSGRQFTAGPGESVLDAAARAGLRLPHQCKTGQCGACKARVRAGCVQALSAPAAALSPQEAADGLCLLCSSAAVSDLSLDCAEVPQLPGIEVRKLPLRVIAMDRLASDVMRLRLQAPAGQSFVWAPGQYVDVLLAGQRRRSYSLATCHPPRGSAECLELHVRHLPGGLFTDFVFGRLKLREVLRIEGPFGCFGMQRESDAPVILLASGTGFAPIKAMLEAALAQGSRRQFSLYWGGRRPEDLYQDALCRSWEQAFEGRLRYVPVLSEPTPKDAWHGRSGFVHQAVVTDFPDLRHHEVYACGAPSMVEAARRDFTALCGLPHDAFSADAFVARRDGPDST